MLYLSLIPVTQASLQMAELSNQENIINCAWGK